MLGFCQNWIFGQKCDFSNSVENETNETMKHRFIEGWKALSHTKVLLTYPRFYFNATCDENVIICIAKLFESSQTKSVCKEKSLAAALQGRGKIHLIYIIYSLKLLSVLYYTPLGSCKVSLKGPLSTQKQSSLLLPPFAFFLKKSTRNPSIHFFFFFSLSTTKVQSVQNIINLTINLSGSFFESSFRCIDKTII